MVIVNSTEFQRIVEGNEGKIVLYLFDKNDPRHEHLSAVLQELENDFPSITFCFLDHLSIKDSANVETLPSIRCYEAKRIVNTMEGCSTAMIVTFIRGWMKEKAQETTLDKIKRLISDNPVIVFIKGTKDDPFCRFSRAVVNMLNKSGIKFEGYNIFEDPELREELKVYSNWPTYPQLYVNGTLIGGHDIIEELYESGSLRDEIPHEYLVN
ncbi:glutaredoxin domain containing protein [Theileria equi strain WA]|uniref:Glutaredoxin domain containing protein n=1 Tax=Theileria equi strain WA TaxID=1537102 RepID=L0AVY8_THEEQ|nr:glutaredoxin domain containing protein [Theileria equi strain WA]AFZ79064.1 glutaredoxin domain containing protein [Theileria equi strain WA]|eukprot:XP_004828730.1 glutaredoxin domain containing protein [Theileria equi strain WA]